MSGKNVGKVNIKDRKEEAPCDDVKELVAIVRYIKVLTQTVTFKRTDWVSNNKRVLLSHNLMIRAYQNPRNLF